MRCARCQGQLGDRYIFSRHTRLRYCIDFQACDRRWDKHRRQAARLELEQAGLLGGGQPWQTSAARGQESLRRLFEPGPPGSCPPPSGPPTTASALVRVGGPLNNPQEEA